MEHAACPCKRIKCERHGNCGECRAYHHAVQGRKSLTRCEKLAAKEQKKAQRRK